MAIKNPDIVSIKEVINSNMDIPIYQRPYRWQESTALVLFNDIIEAYEKNISEYRIGTIILHEEGKSFWIVDGQQRMTTLTLLLRALGCDDSYLKLLNANYKEGSIKAIRTNFMLFVRKVKELKSSLTEDYVRRIKEYILNNCYVVRVITDSEQEAFQFFDSQNSRGKALAPHDLLKAYHLREMSGESEEVKRAVVDHWENLNQEQISTIFEDYLYPMVRWYKKRDGLGYNSNKIQIFKGIRVENAYAYATYHKASHLFTEEFNSKNYSDLIGKDKLNEFVLTEPVIAGRRFFDFVSHYYEMINEVNKVLSAKIDTDLLPTDLTGDRYVKRLLSCSLIMIADRFDLKVINNMTVVNIMYTWAYSLRLVMHSVYESTINNYAIGLHDRINQIPMFEWISDLMMPQEIEQVVLNRVTKSNTAKGNGINKKYRSIAKHINKINTEGFVEL